jgi:hypothetical protein
LDFRLEADSPPRPPNHTVADSFLGAGLLVNGLKLVTIRVDHEGGVIGRAVVRPESGRAIAGRASLDGWPTRLGELSPSSRTQNLT